MRLVKNCDNCTYSGRPSYDYPCTACTSAYGSAPTKWEGLVPANADTVEVIRCKDCKHSRTPGNTAIRYDLPGTLTCMNPDSPCHYRHTLGEGYCPFGERKDG